VLGTLGRQGAITCSKVAGLNSGEFAAWVGDNAVTPEKMVHPTLGVVIAYAALQLATISHHVLFPLTCYGLQEHPTC